MDSQWMRELRSQYVECGVCGELTTADRPTHLLCSLAQVEETYSFPVRFVVGVTEDGA